MTRTTIDLDLTLVERAQAVLGTLSVQATVDRALREVVIANARRQVIAQLRSMDGLDLDRMDVLAQAWR